MEHQKPSFQHGLDSSSSKPSAKGRKKLQSNQSFVCMHPGWCSTDMGGSYAPVDPRIGAERMLKTCLMTELKDDMFYS